MFFTKTDEMAKFSYDYIHEEEFFKNDFHLYIARATDKELKEWTLWAIPTKNWDDPQHHLKPPIFIGKWKNGSLKQSKDFYTLDWTIQNTCRKRFFSEFVKVMDKKGLI